ncbi:DDHD domain-containing protein [Cephalotus follicularis]|uniref:DDHD domain-containing protein n=1 Tax=Cephalotus follicularis TaxID=3775 RepID=A0A1Q3AZP5_CEPFO|nr:DDHD domain-containing protein [Cephalotus follicularis]
MPDSGVDETSPDWLKNTPSNIARLVDEIEQCKGRQKYLAQTRSPSDGGDVRWYFCKVPLAENELAASFPSTEIVGKSDYFRFGMRDSLAIEASFLQREEELLSCWWKEYAECSEGPRVRLSIQKSDAQGNASSSKGAESSQLYEAEEERVGVPVKGGLYEVDLLKRHCFPVYWNGENRRVLRGHWFARKGGLDWLPLREDVAEQLEIAYSRKVWRRRTFQPSGLFAARVDLQGSTSGIHALFTGEDDNWEAWIIVDASGLSSVIGFGGNGFKLRRGYSASHLPKPTQDELRQQKEEEMDDYCSQVPVRHLVFMVHGIGQRLEKSNLVDDVAQFRHITASLAERHLTPHQQGTQRVLFIPCQWRKGLKLGGEAAVEKITLDGVRGLRVMLSATVHDVLYYMSPIYCQDIIDSVSNQLNRLYLKFLKRNPGYDGKVSLYGHSLGSVLSYDILCHQENLSSPFPMDWMYKEQTRYGQSSPDMKNQLSMCKTNMEDKSGTIIKETKEVVNPVDDEQMMNSQSTVLSHEVGHAEGYYTSVDPMISHLDDINARSEVSDQMSGLEGVHESVGNSCEVLYNQRDGLDEAANVNHGAPVSDLVNMAEEELEDTRNKDKEINSLLEEITALKAKIVDLEFHCVDKDSSVSLHQENKGVLASKHPMPEKLSAKLDDAPMSDRLYIKYTKLEFKVDTFFAVGSPLGVFLALRNIRIGIGKGHEYWGEEKISEEFPACRQMFNIFHPFDPVAYRVEPLVCKEYISKRPVIIPYHKGGRRLHIGFQEFTEDLAARSHAIMDHVRFIRVKVLTVCQSRNNDSLEGEETDQEKEERSYGSLMMEKLTGSEGRIDHVLQDKTFEHPYLQAIGSHTNYWRDYDTALFILKHLYRDIPEDPNSPNQSTGENSRPEGTYTQWSDQRENSEEELPLTFSDRLVVKNFSKKARKFMKQ